MKVGEVIQLNVTEYQELSTKNIWPKVRNNKKLAMFFPDYAGHKYPDREYFFAIFCTVYRYYALKLIANSNEKRGIVKDEEEDEVIKITPQFLDEFKQSGFVSSKY
jgi:hypothetical protein